VAWPARTDPWHPLRRRRSRRASGCAAATGGALRPPSGRVQGVQCDPGLLEQYRPGGGQRYMMGAALQQGDTQLGFEFADRTRQRG